mmetsp:Transcript_129300/g.326420  ORF Transcript_129300/g.326420 Transcript_129300/m.326420 type:complete len:226 (-) Transcript_129300:6-683(-)
MSLTKREADLLGWMVTSLAIFFVNSFIMSFALPRMPLTSMILSPGLTCLSLDSELNFSTKPPGLISLMTRVEPSPPSTCTPSFQRPGLWSTSNSMSSLMCFVSRRSTTKARFEKLARLLICAAPLSASQKPSFPISQATNSSYWICPSPFVSATSISRSTRASSQRSGSIATKTRVSSSRLMYPSRLASKFLKASTLRLYATSSLTNWPMSGTMPGAEPGLSRAA